MCCTILYLVFITKKTLIQSGSTKKWVKIIETDSKIVSKSPKLYIVQACTYYIVHVKSMMNHGVSW